MTQGDSLVLHCASLSHEPVRMQNVRDFPQTKLDSEINAPFLLNEHGDRRFFFASFQASFPTTSNLIRQWVKERGIISICDSIWLGANSIKLSRCRGELGGGELTMGRNRQLPKVIQIFNVQPVKTPHFKSLLTR